MSSKSQELINTLYLNQYEKTKDLNLAFKNKIEAFVSEFPELKVDLDSLHTHEGYLICLLKLFSIISTDADDIYQPSTLSKIEESFQIFIYFGVYPCLEERLSSSLNFRTGTDEQLVPDVSRNVEFKKTFLTKLILGFIPLYLKLVDIRRSLFEKYSFEIIISLLQLSNYSRDIVYLKQLTKFLNEIPRHVAFRDLLMAQGIGSNVRNSPRWLPLKAGKYLSVLLIGKSSYSPILSLLVSVCQLTCNNEFEPNQKSETFSVDKKKFKKVSRILAEIILHLPTSLKPKELSLEAFKTSYLQYLSSDLSTIVARKNKICNIPVPIQDFESLVISFYLDLCAKSIEMHGAFGRDLFLGQILPKTLSICNNLAQPESLPSDITFIGQELYPELRIFHDLSFKKLNDTLVDCILTLWLVLLTEIRKQTILGTTRDIQKHLQSLQCLIEDIFKIILTSFDCIEKRNQFILRLLTIPEEGFHLTLFTNLTFLPNWKIIDIDESCQHEKTILKFNVHLTASPDQVRDKSTFIYNEYYPMFVDLLKSLVIQKNVQELNNDNFDQLLRVCEDEMLEDLSLDQLPSYFLIHLLESITRKLMDRLDQDQVSISPISRQEEFTNDLAKMSYFAVLLIESFEIQIIWPKNSKSIITFFRNNLDRILSWMTDEKPMEDDNMISELFKKNLTLTLSLLSQFIHFIENVKDVRKTIALKDQLESLLPVLDEISVNLNTCILDQELISAQSAIISHIRISITTRGALKLDDLQEIFEKTLKVDEEEKLKTSKNLIQELDKEFNNSHVTSEPLQVEAMTTKLKEAYSLLDDPMIPVQGHGLISLCRLIESNSETIHGFEETIFKKLVEMLIKYDDTYIYLNAIRCLTSLGSKYTQRLLPLLCRLFLGDGERSKLNFRLTIGETIVKIAKNLGDLSPKYRDLLVATMTKVANSDEELLRCAALSNLAELCPNLRHSFNAIETEIICLIEFHLKSDRSTNVRQAAVFLTSQVIGASDIDSKLPYWLSQSCLRDLNRLINDRAIMEKDEQVKTSLLQLLHVFNQKTKLSLFDTKVELKKEINILKNFLP